MGETIVLTGGGTAGHIYPALALAEKLIERDFNVVYAGAEGRPESRLAREAGLEFEAFEVSGFDRSRPWSGFSAISKLIAAKKKAKAWLSEIKPAAAVGFGGYVSMPVMLSACELGIKSAIHEQNSYMGIANKKLSKDVDRVHLTYKVAGDVVSDKSKIRITGNPVRSEVLRATKEEGLDYLGIEADNPFVLLVFGGSLGAKSINEAIVSLKKRLLAVGENFYVVQITGKRDYDWVAKELALSDDESKNWKVIDYCDSMPAVLACTDVIVSRSGASSLAEISSLKIPSLLVPYPYATADHQRLNAKEYVEMGAAYEIDDSELSSIAFSELLFDLINNEKTREKMSDAASKFSSADAASALCNSIIEMIK